MGFFKNFFNTPVEEPADVYVFLYAETAVVWIADNGPKGSRITGINVSNDSRCKVVPASDAAPFSELLQSRMRATSHFSGYVSPKTWAAFATPFADFVKLPKTSDLYEPLLALVVKNLNAVAAELEVYVLQKKAALAAETAALETELRKKYSF